MHISINMKEIRNQKQGTPPLTIKSESESMNNSNPKRQPEIQPMKLKKTYITLNLMLADLPTTNVCQNQTTGNRGTNPSKDSRVSKDHKCSFEKMMGRAT